MGNVIQFATDSLRSFIGALGNPGRDKAAGTYYDTPVWSDADLLNAYRGSWMPRKIVDIPAKDMVRKWRDWQAEGDQITAIEAEEGRLNVRTKVFDAMVKARLFGGAAIYIGTGDARPEEEFSPERIGTGGVRFLNVMLHRQLSAGDIENDPESEWFGKPLWYELQGQDGSTRIHPSRLVIFTGAPLPDEELSPNERGWGESVLISILDAIKNADATAANIASLVFEAKVDVIRVPNMMQSLAGAEYRQRLLDRFQLAAAAKGINQTLLLDKEEEYDQKSASFATLPDIMDRFLQMVAGAADIPLTRLLGMTPGGLNATGEHDMKNYHDRLKADQELFVTPAMHRLDEALIRSALGSRPPEVHYRWAPLEQMSEKEIAEIGDKIATTVEKMNNTGLFPPEALANAAANAFVENGIFPGLEQAIEDAGGLPDYEMEAEKEAEAERLRLEAATKGDAGNPTTDAEPRTLYVRRDVKNAADIIAWAKSQGFKTTLPADDLHVTVAFSRAAVDWMKIGESWSSELKVAAGGPRLMEKFGEGAVVLLFKASELEWRHQAMREAGASWDHPEYQPHITITYDPGEVDIDAVEPYQGEIVLGPEIFEEVNEKWREGIKED